MWYTAQAYDELSQTDLYTPPHLIEQYSSSTVTDPEFSGSTFATHWQEDMQNQHIGVDQAVGIDTGDTTTPHLTWDTVSIKESGKLPSGSDKNVDIEYPKFNGDASVAKLNEYISTLVLTKLNEDRAYVAKKKIPVYYVDGNPNAPFQAFSEGTLDLGIRYVVTGGQNGVVSIELMFVSYAGGGNGDHEDPSTINWDLRANKPLAPADLFCSPKYVSLLRPLAREQLIADYGKPDDNTQYWVDSVTRGVQDPDLWNNFLLSKDGLIIVFPPYALGPGVYTVQLNEKNLKNILCVP